jgi:hypothetical protein
VAAPVAAVRRRRRRPVGVRGQRLLSDDGVGVLRLLSGDGVGGLAAASGGGTLMAAAW